MKQHLTIANRLHLPLRSQPIRQGVPWPQGLLTQDCAIGAETEDGKRIPAATRVLNRWLDGSVQWSLVDFNLDLEPSQTRIVTLDTREKTGTPPPTFNPVEVVEGDTGIGLRNGIVDLVVAKKNPKTLIGSWTCEGREVLSEDGFDAIPTDETGSISGFGSPSRPIGPTSASRITIIISKPGSQGSIFARWCCRCTARYHRRPSE